MLICAVDDRHSFEYLDTYLSAIEKIKDGKIPVVVALNKMDLSEYEHLITKHDVMEMVLPLKSVEVFETSGETRMNVDEMFEHLAMKCYLKDSKENAMRIVQLLLPQDHASHEGNRRIIEEKKKCIIM